MTLYIGPTFVNDAIAYKTTAQRAREDKIVPLFIHDKIVEAEHLDGDWYGLKKYFNEVLPELRESIRVMLEADPHADVHIDIGSDLGSIYAAYYVALERRPFSITVHNAQPTPEEANKAWQMATGSKEPMPAKYLAENWAALLQELKTYFPVLLLGGRSLWAQTHPLMIRKLMMIVLVRAASVYVTSQEAAYTLMETFPRVEREYEGAPLESIAEGSSAHAASLSSPA